MTSNMLYLIEGKYLNWYIYRQVRGTWLSSGWLSALFSLLRPNLKLATTSSSKFLSNHQKYSRNTKYYKQYGRKFIHNLRVKHVNKYMCNEKVASFCKAQKTHKLQGGPNVGKHYYIIYHILHCITTFFHLLRKRNETHQTKLKTLEYRK